MCALNLYSDEKSQFVDQLKPNMDNVKRESPLFLRKMSLKTLKKSAFETDSDRVDTFLSKEVFRLFAWWFELVPAVPNLRKKVISKS